MASSFTVKVWFFAVVVMSVVTLCHSQQIPSQIVTRALYCLNNRLIYRSCQEDYRLSADGSINVPPQAVDAYCTGPCIDETRLVLNCVDGIISNFIFDNGATTRAVRSTIIAACSDSSQRGNFNVAAHILDEDNQAEPLRPLFTWLSSLALFVLWSAFLH
ncbi:hypothetical protein H6P81_004105 [Aristolochia fimbriata]|uniref:DUF7731 domain-containing protein n=1 Tax=Aristolochia fimbriata TaxID=158543 RepID=A0AAV7FH79_ARIFI|nr:hypothetical protein H6P81_004105 [Aristolochia fimbriata]